LTKLERNVLSSRPPGGSSGAKSFANAIEIAVEEPSKDVLGPHECADGFTDVAYD
jgi:hypothetical protein